MRCLYCDGLISKEKIFSLLIKKDVLCPTCRRKMGLKKAYVRLDDLLVETFYDYDSLFRDVLIQYKECMDEALSEVFLYEYEDYLKIKYHGYRTLYVPSSQAKLELRGFNHLELIFAGLDLKKVEGLHKRKELIQEGKNRKEREAMIDNYFYEGERLGKVLIVDDVMTTGSSLRGAYKAIAPYCERVKLLCLARGKKTLSL